MLVDDPDETHERAPEQCGGCRHDLAGAEEFSRQRRQVVDLPPPPKPHVVEYQVVSLVCPDCGAISTGEAPDGVSGRIQFGRVSRRGWRTCGERSSCLSGGLPT